MNMRATIEDRVKALVRRMAGAAVCDECITDRLDLSSVAQTAVVTLAVSGGDGFERLRAPCTLCARDKPVIRHKA